MKAGGKDGEGHLERDTAAISCSPVALLGDCESAYVRLVV